MMKGIKNIRESFKTRQVKYGGYAALITLAVIVGLILVNLMMGQFAFQVDLTWSKLFSLSEQTMQVLGTVKTPVKFYGLWRPGEESQDVMNVVNLYLSKNSNISLELVDPERNPGFVAKYDKDRKGISRGSLIVEGTKGFRVVAPYDMYDFNYSQQTGARSVTGMAAERRITSALLFAGTGNTPVIYELTGHGETPLVSFGMVDLVERENYELKSVNLLLAPVPADASAIIINDPARDLTPDEANKLLGYLAGGGRLLVTADYGIQELANLNEVLASYGIQFDYGIVREIDPYYVAIDPRSEWPDLRDHDITNPLSDKTKTPVVLLEAMSLSELATKRRSVEIKPLMTSSASAFLRTDINETSYAKVAADIPGPLTLGAAITDPSWIDPNKPEPQARIVAIGCGSLLNIAASGFDANRDVFMNSLTWLQDRPETISVRSKSLFVLPMRLTLVQIIIFGGLFIAVIPLAFFIAGFVTWLKRRHL
jgi:uncharacterized membrane protein (Fun14 family)